MSVKHHPAPAGKMVFGQQRFALVLLILSLILIPFPIGTTDSSMAQDTAGEVAQTVQKRQPPSLDLVERKCLEWLDRHAEAAQLETGKKIVEQARANQSPLDLIITTIAFIDQPTRTMQHQLASMPRFAVPAALESYQPEIDDPWMETNLNLWMGLELARRELYEEALQKFQQVQQQHLVDPAAYYFYRAVCEHHLLKKEQGLASLDILLNQCTPLPSRYRMVGELMKQDLVKLQEKSLDEIARKMNDVERRLELGRAGKKVQKIEREIVESLDELIKKLEEQSGGGSGSGSGSGNQPNSAAKDSSVKGSTAPGKVDDKDLGHKSNWGNLPPKEQAKAKQILGTLFPPHYRRAIEAYNRKAAQREATESAP